MIGRQLSHYTVLERLGAGAMGEVYRARDEKLGREVAIKVLHPSFVADPERKERFLREARLTSLLSHPNIATVYSADEVDGVIFFAMELVRGRPSKRGSGPGAWRARSSSTSPSRSPRDSPRPTGRASSTATSSPPTS